jgi:xanthine dehydrogenase accessory factor
MSRNTLELAYRLTQQEEPFVLATVVWCERPTSSKPGAQAIIHSDGHVTGWIGGSCAQPVVVREARRVLQEGGDPFLLRLGSQQDDLQMARTDMRVFPMTCSSGGALDIYMEPHLPRSQLLLIGDSPVIVALQQLAPVLNFTVTHITSTDVSQVQINNRTYVLVASHGQYDEDALMQVLPTPATYVGMVGSKRRAASCVAFLHASGVAEEHIARLKAPAGLDIGAVTPEEIAASVLAELIQVQRREQVVRHTAAPGAGAQMNSVPASSTPETAIDLVCGMIVETASARHHLTYQDQEYYFCCPACKRLFQSDPTTYLVQSGTPS